MKKAVQTCPIEKTATLLSDIWTMLIMHALLPGNKRFCELERELSPISTRTLTLKLKRLEQDGMIKKSNDGSYSATEKGKGLRTVERAMKRYGERWLVKA
ncbi:MAG: helix-turn-helix domain-containing protein [Candidatus Pacebacteria bacterium]|nr:helix-turn-helix domain-containing protein [Candidatus Paceibacterota bacterium]